jgi:hypothetical protein
VLEHPISSGMDPGRVDVRGLAPSIEPTELGTSRVDILRERRALHREQDTLNIEVHSAGRHTTVRCTSWD